ncbi:potassium channel protein [candidate division KSB1 bacterium]|nr:potassium channel protein [candidate division KSB1 bacterium]RQW01073.1 MAG: potassium channel protein [candidate division KSB1 bacterium]
MKNVRQYIPSVLRPEDDYSPQFSLQVLRGLLFAFLLLLILVIIGTTGYSIILKTDFLESLYMTVITISTVGFREGAGLATSVTGKVFTIFLIFSGLAIGGYAIGTIAAFLTEGQLLKVLKESRMVREITNLQNHTIVCGYGKIGTEVCARLFDLQEPFIVIDQKIEKIDEAVGLGYLAVVGDASDDEVLTKVGVKKAKALVSAITDDSANVYLVLTARTLNEKLYIVARGTDEKSRKKLERVGANRVVSPYEIGARRMAAYIVRPAIVDFLDAFSPDTKYDLHLEHIVLGKSSGLVGKKLKESNIRELTRGALVVGMCKEKDKMDINPPGDTVLEEGNILLAIGSSEQLVALQGLAR